MFRLVKQAQSFIPQLKSKSSLSSSLLKQQNKCPSKLFTHILNKPVYCRLYTTQSYNTNNDNEQNIKANEEVSTIINEQNPNNQVHDEEFDKDAFLSDVCPIYSIEIFLVLTFIKYSIPFIAKLTSSCILLPFIACSAGPFFLPLHVAGQCVFLQMTLGSSMLSFFGGVHWGLALANYKRNDYIIIEDEAENKINHMPQASTLEQYIRIAGSVLVPCASWMLMSLPPVQGMVGLMICYTAFHVIEMGLHTSRLLPSWYIRLKSYLTFGIVLSFGINLIHML